MVKYVKIEETVKIPSDVSFELEKKLVKLEGPKGKVDKDFNHMKSLDFSIVDVEEGKEVVISAPKKQTISLVKTAKNVIQNLIKGVKNLYTYKMKIVYSHFPITVIPPKNGEREVQIMNFIGERSPRIATTIGNVTVKATKQEVEVSGCDKDHVGQTCANIQSKCRIRDKDKRVFQDGVYVFSKQLGDNVVWRIR